MPAIYQMRISDRLVLQHRCTPIVGKTKYQNLYTNTDMERWLINVGSAKLLLDIISHKTNKLNMMI